MNFTRQSRRSLAAGLMLTLGAGIAGADVFDLVDDWSDTQNPNGAWSYNAGGAPLPTVAWWQRIQGGFTAAQPGWAQVEDGLGRIPFWFKSSAGTTFVEDFEAGDVVVHTQDDSSAPGVGPANVTWKSTACGAVDIFGSIWQARDIGRRQRWTLSSDGFTLAGGEVFDGDPYSRAAPAPLSSGAAQPDGLLNVPVQRDSLIKLELVRVSPAGEFVGVSLRLETRGGTITRGDTNCDGLVNFDDIDSFVTALASLAAYRDAQPGCFHCNADVNADERVDFDDIDRFVECLIAGSCAKS